MAESPALDQADVGVCGDVGQSVSRFCLGPSAMILLLCFRARYVSRLVF